VQPQLVVVAGPDRGRVFRLVEGQTLVVGRGRSNDTRLRDARVSRVHCHVWLDEGATMLSDAGSMNGTRVNGRRVASQQLQPGDLIHVGDTKLAFRLEAPRAAAAALRAGARLPRMESLKDLAGHTLWHYALEGVLGRGATGIVFRAHDVRNGKPAAVKVLAPQFASTDEQRQRFVRAMKTMLPVRHENIVRLYAAGKKGPFCWAAMELVEGENMADAIRRIGVAGRIDWHQGFRVAVHIARALDAAFRQKFIHRNVTPTNILQRKSDKLVKLGDLMLAKALEGVLSRKVTQPGRLVGDLPYLAPERTLDDAEPDTRSDLYGLGATVYALVAGRPPFEGKSLPELVLKIRDDAPAPPKKFQLALPDLFQDAVLKLLAKRPDDRYQTPEQLLRDLLRIGKFCGVAECD
jgi:serine/threonine protein kinase